jgi:7-keto-8-aminopelargonate synthetase-like enzyme
MVGKKPGRIGCELGGEAAIAEFLRTRGATRCPTACVLPTQASLAPADRAALEEYATARDRHRNARAAARQNPFTLFTSVRPRPASPPTQRDP